VVGVVIGAAAFAQAPAGAAAHRRPPVTAPPKLLSLSYGRYANQTGSRPSPGLRLRAREPRGQVVEVVFQELHHGIADGVGGVGRERCERRGHHSGSVQVTDMLLGQPLSRGTHEIRVIAYGSRCTADSLVVSAVRTFTIHVRH
jgi:hypothetical protein